jgi:hypothetical protein
MARVVPLADFYMDHGCRFRMWSEEQPNGSYSIHFQAPCPRCAKLAREVCAEATPGVPINVED